MEILILIFGVIIGSIFIYILLKPKLKITQQLNEEILIKNKDLQNDLLKLTKEHSSLISKKEEVLLNIKTLQKQAEDSCQVIYEKNYELINEKIDQAAEKISNKYKQAEEFARNSYLKTMEELTDSFQSQIFNKKIELDNINNQLIDLSVKLDAAVEANKRAEEMRTKKDFYRLQLSSIDIEEIERLRSVTQYIRNSEPINKVIWKVYYEKPYTDLIGRVIGTGVHTGIYKITNIENQMCYIGQSTNISERWKQHIKRGIGAETPTRNKLYPAMLKFGIENFTFEIIEECDKSNLNSREDYWQSYFHAKDFGYSVK